MSPTRPSRFVRVLATWVAIAPVALHAQDGRPDAVRNHILALEEAHRSSIEELADRFQREHFSEGYLVNTAEAERRRVLEAVRIAAGDAGEVTVEVEDGRYVLTLSGARVHRVSFAVAEDPPFRIDALDVGVTEVEPIALTRENLAATLRRLEGQGMAGVAFVRLGEEVLFDDGFGLANEDLGLRNRPETVFGIGSRPIDFTVAALHLLRQEGRLAFDDPITRHFPDVPPDKRGITIRHLMTGGSGLPDFLHQEEDWDPDLAWIDRATAERRILGQELLFEPGTDRRHSHGAFGLLAALVERVSGRPYYDFLREHFFELAGMDRTGEYGETRGLALDDFAVGYGAQRVGSPNIPPNWGPTSWLVKGSGGIYSSLGDLRRFYELVRESAAFDDEFRAAFSNPATNLDGSERGFELFSIYEPGGHEVYVFLNRMGDRQRARELFRALGRLVASSG